MTPGDPSRRFASLLKKMRTRHAAAAPPAPDPADDSDPLVDHVVFSLMLWEASSGQARAAFKRLREAYVDYNELRVCMPDELADVLGERYPLAHERARRLRAALSDVYRREHAVSLTHLTQIGKREARAYLDSLDGLTPFVSARVVLLALNGHAVPCDERLRDLLAEAGVMDADTSAGMAGSWLERHVDHTDALKAHAVLQAWSDEHGHPPRREKKTIVMPPAPAPSPAPKPARPQRQKPETTRASGKPRSGS